MKTRHQQGYIYKKSAWWYVRYYEDVIQEDGSIKRVQLAHRIAPVCDAYRSKRAVKPLVQDFLRPLNSGAYGPEGTMTLERFVGKGYLPHVAAQKRPSTYRGYKNLWEECLKPRCGNLRLREFRTCHGERLLAEIARQKPLSRNTLKHIKSLLSGIFKHAKRLGAIDGINPIQDVSIPRGTESHDTYAYSLEEILQMLTVLPEPAATAVTTAAFTGMRKGELRGLLWENYSQTEIRVTQSVWEGFVTEPKTRKSKSPVPVIGPLAKKLDALRLTQGNPESGLMRVGKESELRVNRTERDVDTLSAIADIVIDTQRNTDTDVLVRVATRLGLYGRGVERLVDVLVGGQYGSEGKGHVASYIAPEYDVLVRVGGPNAGHKVYELPEPYTFHQLPSGTRCSEARLVLGPGAVIRAPQLQKEIADCAVSKERLSIDPQAMIIDDADITFENELKTTIGSTGQGVGAATARKILRTTATPLVRLAKDVAALNPFVRETLQVLEKAFSDGRKVLLEGTQGTGLSLHHGPYPYVTSRDTSGSGCLAEAGIGPSRVRKTLMVIRSYPIRVQSPKGGTSGPMGGGKELSWQEISRRSGIPLAELLKTERTSTTDRRRRVAEFDWFMLRRAVSLNSPTDIAMTFADYISVENRKAIRFEQLTEETLRFVEEIERVATAPVSLIATRFESRSIIDRRSW